jgi:hypothetical protein
MGGHAGGTLTRSPSSHAKRRDRPGPAWPRDPVELTPGRIARRGLSRSGALSDGDLLGPLGLGDRDTADTALLGWLGGVGELAPTGRAEAAGGLAFLGTALDPDRNDTARCSLVHLGLTGGPAAYATDAMLSKWSRVAQGLIRCQQMMVLAAGVHLWYGSPRRVEPTPSRYGERS